MKNAQSSRTDTTSALVVAQAQGLLAMNGYHAAFAFMCRNAVPIEVMVRVSHRPTETRRLPGQGHPGAVD